MTDGPRRSARRAYVSLEALQERARAVATEEEQKTFWGNGNTDDFDDDESFDENAQSDAGEDIVDSDFDQPEDAVQGEPDKDKVDVPTANEAAVRLEERRTSRRERTGRYVDPATKKKSAADKPKLRKDVGQSSLHPSSGAVAGQGSGAEGRTTIASTRSSLRKSTKAASARAAEERERRRVGEVARRRQKALRNADRQPARPLTQAERLEAAKMTELLNRDSLNDLLRMEEEKTRVPVVNRREPNDIISTRSRDGKWTVSFTDGVDPQQVMFPPMKPDPA